jgi:hypothetical protein
MIYVLFTLSIVCNIMLVWYVKKILKRYFFDSETNKQFAFMLEQYAEALEAVYKLEEFYGEETIKKAINQTKFVVEACQEYKKAIEEQIPEDSAEDGEEDDGEEAEEGPSKKEEVIRLREGESITQDAASYKRVAPAR